jgi:hypothetical protein
LAGTFFLDVYEHRKWGEKVMRELAVRLQDAGQDVALHTHPQWAYDPARWGMYQYSLNEQMAIIGDGVQLLREWTGKPVVAHRTGAYAADDNTLTALERHGVRIDSSVFWQYPDNRLDGLGLPRNIPASRRGLLEIPVTVYARADRPGFAGTSVAPVLTIRKLDPNWFGSESEMRGAIAASVAADLPVLVILLHSFSFMADPAGGKPVLDARAVAMFTAMLDELTRRRLPVVTMRDLAQDPPPLLSSARDVVPEVAVTVDLPRYAWRRAKASRVAAAPVAGGGVALFAGAVAVAAFRRRRARREGRAA